jgi:hypothetical protein
MGFAHSPDEAREHYQIGRWIRCDMAGTTIEEKALRALAAFERAGKSVSRVTLDGRKIELVLKTRDEADEFERIDMRHGKT